MWKRMNRLSKQTLIDKYKKETIQQIKKLPFNVSEIPEIVCHSWEDIFTISDTNKDFVIGKTVFPKPQMMGFFLETLIAKRFEKMDGEIWISDPTGFAKDITNRKDDSLSIEIKTSSSKSHIYGNRSYANPGATSKKSKDSFYLAINFDKFDKAKLDKEMSIKPKISLIRFGYLKSSDWSGQVAPSGQQARLTSEIEKGKLIELWPHMDPLLINLNSRKQTFPVT